LDASLWWGDLVISGITLRDDILRRYLDLPFELREASIASIALRVPWLTVWLR
ncbi:unnamed protein product, partial [Phaeothamnion confervicola]